MSTDIAALAQELSSLDHAVLLSLLAKQHCLIETTADAIDNVAHEIQLIATQLFGLSFALVDCSQETTLDDFNRDILIPTTNEERRSPHAGGQPHSSTAYRQASTYSVSKPQSSEDYSIANLVIAKSLGAASRQVQVQALELIRANRIFTHTAVYAAPRPFLLVVLASTDDPALNVHLIDLLLLSHYHDPLDELPRLEAREYNTSTTPSTPSLAPKPHSSSNPSSNHGETSPAIPISASLLQDLSSLPPSIILTSETRSYLMSLAISIRTHRALTPGSATPTATKHLELLARCLALLHGIDFVTPALVALAARKVYRHRLRVLKPSDAAWERSVMYGSRVADVRELLERMWQNEDGEMRSQGEVAEGIIDGVVVGLEVPV